VERLTLVKVAETSEILVGQMKVVKLVKKKFDSQRKQHVLCHRNSCTHMHGELSKGLLEVIR